jgi:hypothetical protein
MRKPKGKRKKEKRKRSSIRLSYFFLFPFSFFLVVGECRAQLPQIRLDRIFPLGARAGEQVVLDIAGKDLQEAKALHFDRPGFKAELIKPNQFKVTVTGDVPPGTYEVRAVGKFGISGSRLLAVQRGLTEVREVEPNDTLDKAQAVPMNVAINGTSDANGVDYYRFPARKGERVTIDCQAYRLDSLLRASLTVLTADGRELARGRPYFDRFDVLIDFVVPADGNYLVRLHDATYNGDLPYRLVISTRPLLEVAFPPALAPGPSAQVVALGRNFATAPSSTLLRSVANSICLCSCLQIPLSPCHLVTLSPCLFPAPAPSGWEALPCCITPPTDPRAIARLDFSVHLPAPALNARGFQVWPKEVPDALNPLTLLWASAPLTLEREPNDTPQTAQQLTLPTVVCGRFDQPGDVDWYAFTAKAGEKIAVDLYAERLGWPGDPFVVVVDGNGNELETYDDQGNAMDPFSQQSRDPAGVFTVPADGTYQLRVQERYGGGGPRYVYALRVGKAEPDFYPLMFHETTNDASCPVLRRGGTAFYEFCLNRRDGFDGPATVEAEELPRGVSCPPVYVSPQTEFATVVFRAAADAPEWSGPIRLNAWATIGGKRVERAVACAERRFPDGNANNTARACRQVCLAVRAKAAYVLQVPAVKRLLPPGGSLEVKVKAERYWPDFKGAIQVAGWKPPPGFDVTPAEIAADKTETRVKISAGGDVPPGVYSLVLRGEAQIAFQPDPNMADKPIYRVADPALPLTLVVIPFQTLAVPAMTIWPGPR